MSADEGRNLGRIQEYLRQIVLGGSDGIVTTFAIVAGFAGAGAEGAATVGTAAVILFGLANLAADAVSMGLGEFLSGRSEREVYIAERRRETDAIARDPEAAALRIAAMLHRRGIRRDEAQRVSEILRADAELTADLVMVYGRGMPDPRGGSPALRGLVTFAAFVAFGVLPLVPYLFAPHSAASFPLALAGTFVALVLLGLARARATAEPLLRAVGETLAVGGACSVAAYAVGWAIGG